MVVQAREIQHGFGANGRLLHLSRERGAPAELGRRDHHGGIDLLVVTRGLLDRSPDGVQVGHGPPLLLYVAPGIQGLLVLLRPGGLLLLGGTAPGRVGLGVVHEHVTLLVLSLLGGRVLVVLTCDGPALGLLLLRHVEPELGGQVCVEHGVGSRREVLKSHLAIDGLESLDEGVVGGGGGPEAGGLRQGRDDSGGGLGQPQLVERVGHRVDDRVVHVVVVLLLLLGRDATLRLGLAHHGFVHAD